MTTLPIWTTPVKKPPGTSMEGMVWNANHVLDMALMPAIKKNRDVLEDARGVVLLDTVDIGLVFAGTRGSGVVMAKNEKGEWSAPSAVTLTSLKLGWVLGRDDQGIMIVWTTDEELDHFLSGASVEFGAGLHTEFDTVKERENLGAVNQYLTSKGAGSCYAYTYRVPNTYHGMSLQGVTIKHHAKANERFYGKETTPFDIVRKGEVTVPEGSGIPDLHKKLAALEMGEDIEATPEMEEKKEQLRKAAHASAVKAKEDLGDEVEEINVAEEKEDKKAD